ncbi:MAG: paraquat-inducible protein A [Deltaproteobacteria bacterium]|nr:paraquat-inducible protein A [Deltaproteobacteria bacterium]MBW2447323.1 paraquat-inducible protein A [Deltaproteobacteria bacterium]
MSAAPMTASAAGLMGCHACGMVVRKRHAKPGQSLRCPRCEAPVHARKPDSLQRTTALLFTAAVLYIPANLFPIMTVISFGQGQADTILSGVIHLAHGGMISLALLVFFASVLVPVLKLSGLTFLLLSVHLRWQWRPRDRTLLYRIIESVGRWSMIDIFMISILVALVKLGNVATIETGLGATCFGAVVVITMFASMSFDPRLIWDVMEEEE